MRRIALILIVLLWSQLQVAHTQVKGLVFGDFNVGGGYDNSIFRDASKIGDGYSPNYIGTGWRGKLSKKTTARAYYRFYYLRYRKESTETNYEHNLNSNILHRLYGPLYLRLNLEGESYRQPRFTIFNFSRYLYEPGFEYRLPSDTILRSAYVYETESYPNFDLDYKAPGYKMEVLQDVTLYGTMDITFTQFKKNYTNRKLVQDTSGLLTDQKRKDLEKELQFEFNWDYWRKAQMSAGFYWFDVSSNGNFLDFGPNQSAIVNTITGDERLLSNYYSNTKKGPYAGITLSLPRLFSLNIYNRWLDVDYKNRIARNNLDQFLGGDPIRSDKRQILSVQLTKYKRVRPFTLGWTLGWHREHSKSNDALYSFNNNRYFFTFRGWF